MEIKLWPRPNLLVESQVSEVSEKNNTFLFQLMWWNKHLLIRIFFQWQKCAIVIWYFCWIHQQIGFSRWQFFFFNMPLPLVFLVVCSKQINQCTPMLPSIIFLSELNRMEAHWAQVNVLHSRVNVLHSLVLKSICSWILCVYQVYK